eukprot:gene11647-14821_t
MTVITLFLLQKKPAWFKLALMITCIYLASDVFRQWQFSKTDRWTVYAVKDGTVIRHQTGRHVYEYRSPAVPRKGYSFSVAPSDRAFAVNRHTSVTPINGFLSFGNRNVLLLQRHHLKNPSVAP